MPILSTVTQPLRHRQLNGRLLSFVFSVFVLSTSYAEDDAADTASGADESETAVAEANSAAGINRMNPQLTASRHAAVIDYLTLHQRQHEVVKLIAEDIPFHGLFIQENAGTPQGGILLLHDDQQHSHWPAATAPLREYLPNYGWATLAIELPSLPEVALPPRGKYTLPPGEQQEGASEKRDITPAEAVNDQQPQDNALIEPVDSTAVAASGNPEPPVDDNPTPENEPPLPRLTGLPDIASAATTATNTPTDSDPSAESVYQQQLRARLQQGIEYLNSRGQLNVVLLATGQSASWAVEFLLNKQQELQANNEELRGYTLVLIDPQQSPQHQLHLAEQLQYIEFPVLDLVTDQGIATASEHRRRAGMMKHRQRRAYRQIHINEPDALNSGYQTVKRRVRGWLKTHAAGTEIPSS